MRVRLGEYELWGEDELWGKQSDLDFERHVEEYVWLGSTEGELDSGETRSYAILDFSVF